MREPDKTTVAFHELFEAVRPLVSFQTLREIMLAAHGKKVSRLSLQEAEIPRMVELLERAGLRVALHDRKYVLSADQGKGGWVSGYGLEVPIESPLDGYIMLYIGQDAVSVASARKAEHTSLFSEFGSWLSYPSCCIDFYEKHLPEAEREQGDFILYLIEESMKSAPGNLPLFPFWNNISAQYFGYGLISFYPCSFFCEEAAISAKEAWQILSLYDASLANSALEAAKQPILYTEYEGIYTFGESAREGNILHYDGRKVECSLKGVLADLLTAGDELHICSPHDIEVRKAGSLLAKLKSHRMGMMLFS